MTIDPTAERANDPGWTKQAKAEAKAQARAQARAEKARVDAAKKAGAQAWRRAVLHNVGRFFVEAWDFILRNLMLSIAIGATIATGAWEWWNSSRGWQDLYPGAGLFAYIGALGAVGLWFVAFRMAREEGRKPKGERSVPELVGWIVAALFSYIVCVAGVFVATATNSIEAQKAASQSRIDYSDLVAKRDTLQETLETFSVEYWEAMIKQDRRTLDAQLGIARGTFEMADLDVDGACAAKLSFNQRRLCAQVNGGIDEFTGQPVKGLRSELERSEFNLTTARANVEKLADLEKQIQEFRVLSGDETSEAMGSMFDFMKAEASMGLILLFLSSVFLATSGWTGDWSLQKIEAQRIAGRQKAGRI